MDGELEHEWQMRRTKVIKDMLYSMYEWIDKPEDDSRTGFSAWLK